MRGRFIRIIALFVSRFEKLVSWSDCSFSAFISEFDTNTYLSSAFDPYGSLSRTWKISTFLIVNIHKTLMFVSLVLDKTWKCWMSSQLTPSHMLTLCWQFCSTLLATFFLFLPRGGWVSERHQQAAELAAILKTRWKIWIGVCWKSGLLDKQ